MGTQKSVQLQHKNLPPMGFDHCPTQPLAPWIIPLGSLLLLSWGIVAIAVDKITKNIKGKDDVAIVATKVQLQPKQHIKLHHELFRIIFGFLFRSQNILDLNRDFCYLTQISTDTPSYKIEIENHKFVL